MHLQCEQIKLVEIPFIAQDNVKDLFLRRPQKNVILINIVEGFFEIKADVQPAGINDIVDPHVFGKIIPHGEGLRLRFGKILDRDRKFNVVRRFQGNISDVGVLDRFLGKAAAGAHTAKLLSDSAGVFGDILPCGIENSDGRFPFTGGGFLA